MNLSNFTDTAVLMPVTVIDYEERENRMYEREVKKRIPLDLHSVRCVKDEKMDGSQVANDKNMEIKKDGDSLDVKTYLNDSRSVNSITKKIMTDSRDGQTYKTVKIGSQIWMAENLNYKMENSFCFDNVDCNCTKYGRLYVNSKDVCPVGWHLPAKWEWVKLFSVLNDSSTVGKKIKSTEGWLDDGNGTDEFGFSAIANDYKYDQVVEEYVPGHTYFWSSTEDSKNGSYFVYDIHLSCGGITLYDESSKHVKRSVRCLKD